MSSRVYLPTDEFTGSAKPNLDLAADYLELKAFLSRDCQAFSQDIVDAMELSADGEFDDLDEEMRVREDIASGAINRMALRQRPLKESYPFKIDKAGGVVTFEAEEPSLGQAAYVVSLVLSNLKPVTPLLQASEIYPSDQDVRTLRLYFQYFATAAIAAELGGPAWSFGHPRPDGTGFIAKLTMIWNVLKDGTVSPDPSAPHQPQDDQIDVFARREQRDELPGFLLAAGQVATGKEWKEKSIKAHVAGTFYQRWFGHSPVTRLIPYHIIPFARPDDLFRDDVLVLGNILHRLRLPYRVDEASQLVAKGISIEAFDKLSAAIDWVKGYGNLARAA